MNSAQQLLNGTSSQSRSYLFAFVMPLGALLVVQLFHAPTASFVAAVMVTSYIGTRTAGYLATTFAGLLFYFFFLRPLTSFVAPSAPSHRLVAFLVTGCIISELAQMSRTN